MQKHTTAIEALFIVKGALGILLACMALAGLAGSGMMIHEESFFAALPFISGTALSIYAPVILFNDEVKPLFT